MSENTTLQKVINIIIRTIPTERIAILAYTNKEGASFSIFNNTYKEPSDAVAVNLLVVGKSPSVDRVLQDIAEQKCKALLHLDIILLTSTEFENQAKEKSSFILRTIQAGQWIYERLKIPFHEFSFVGDDANTSNSEEKLFCWYKRAALFYQSAGMHHRFGELGMAAFCLHQVTEQLLIMLIQAATGYRLGSHNLEKLLRVLRFHNSSAVSIFPVESEHEKELLQLLKNTYIKYRYRPDLQITETHINYFLGEIARLQALADEILFAKPEPLLTPVCCLHHKR